MQIIVSQIDGLTVIALIGRFLGDQAVDDFCDAIKLQLDAGDKKLVVDLSGIDYINSMGLGALIAGHIIALNDGGKIIYANGNARVRELLHLTKTDRSVPVCDTVEDAKALFI